MNPDFTPRAHVHQSRGGSVVRLGALVFLTAGSAVGGWDRLTAGDVSDSDRLAGVGLMMLAALLVPVFVFVLRSEQAVWARIVVTDEDITQTGRREVRIHRNDVTEVRFQPAPRGWLLGPLEQLSGDTLVVHAGQRSIRFSRGGDWDWAVDLVRAWVRERPELAANDATREAMTAPDHTPLVSPTARSRWSWLAWIGLALSLASPLIGKLFVWAFT